jgi:hypothetical protein
MTLPFLEHRASKPKKTFYGPAKRYTAAIHVLIDSRLRPERGWRAFATTLDEVSAKQQVEMDRRKAHP